MLENIKENHGCFLFGLLGFFLFCLLGFLPFNPQLTPQPNFTSDFSKSVSKSLKSWGVYGFRTVNSSFRAFYKDIFGKTPSSQAPLYWHRLFSRSYSHSVYTLIAYNIFRVFIPICISMDAPRSLMFAGVNPAFYAPRKITKVWLFF